MSDKDAFTAGSSDPRFTTFISIVKRSGLEASARGTQAFTVFAPTEKAFNRYPELRESLLGPTSDPFPDTQALVVFVRSHVLLGLHPSPPLGERDETLTSRVGTPINVRNTKPVTVSWESTHGQIETGTLSNQPIVAKNAIIYPIDNPILIAIPSNCP
ncbi:MAG: fasciclin domain-containing protein [Beijerinckiaceae bacterium]